MRIKLVFLMGIIFFMSSTAVFGEELTHKGTLDLYTPSLEKKDDNLEGRVNITDKRGIELFTKKFIDQAQELELLKTQETEKVKNQMFLTTTLKTKEVKEQAQELELFSSTKNYNSGIQKAPEEKENNITIIFLVLILGVAIYFIYLFFRKKYNMVFNKPKA